MKWDESKTKNVSLYQARISDLDINLASELWLKFLTLFKAYASNRSDAIKVEIWADSGRVIMFPGVAANVDRDEDFCLEIHVGFLFDFWERLSDSDIDDDTFDNQVNTHVRNMIDILSDGLQYSLKSNPTLNPNRKLDVLYSDGDRIIVQFVI